MRRYTRRVEITLDKDSFSVAIKKMENDEQVQFLKYALHDIISYKIRFPNRRFASIVFNLRSNKTAEYSFLQKKLDSDQVDTNILIESFHSLITDYNGRQSEFEKISFVPSFYASKYGLYTISGLMVLLGIAIMLHVAYSMKSLPISLFLGLAIILQIVFKRKADMAFYEKMK